MNVVTSTIISLHVLKRINELRSELGVQEAGMTAKLRGVNMAMDQLNHDLDVDADRLLARVQQAQEKRKTVFQRSHARLDSHETELANINESLDELDRSNEPPLASSEDTSDPRSSEVAALRAGGTR